jgi:hypothetical protein
MKRSYHIYAIRLDDAVLEDRRFTARNPGHRPGKPCYYIGSSIYEPATRFAKHKGGQKAARVVRKWGLYVAKKKCFIIETEDHTEPAKREAAYAEDLRTQGFGIWQN